MAPAAEQTAKFSAIAYVYVTLFGVIHDIALEAKTGLDPFAFYGVEDFFLAGARHPGGALLALAVPLAMLLSGTVATVASGAVLRVFRPALAYVYGRISPPRGASACSGFSARFTAASQQSWR